MHTVGILALDGVIPFDLATPAETFGRARLPDGRPAYRVRVASVTNDVDAGLFTLRAPWRLDELMEADTIVVPGLTDPTVATPAAALAALRAAASQGTRIASICVGAFILAEAGLLDGLRATTHWAATGLLAQSYPTIEVDPDVLYVDNGAVLTSAGAAAGLDLCLHMVRRDHGSAVAADTARVCVMPLERDGGQAQFIAYRPPADASSLEPLLRWIEEHLDRPLTLEAIAQQASLSPRSLHRHFQEQVGTTPMQWVRRQRLRRAQHLLETTDHSIDRIAHQVGFGSTTTFRDHFTATLGTGPRSYRRSFRSTV